VELIDLLAPLLLLADFAFREFARRIDRRACGLVNEPQPQAERLAVPGEVRVFHGIYLRDDDYV
jgi:hypothetical protein